MTEKTGFIGLGIMGLPMASNLIKGGHSLIAYNRTAFRAESLPQGEVEIASSPLEVSENSETVILMLSDTEAVDEVLWSKNGLLAKGHCCKTVINMSTVAPSYTKVLNQKLEQEGVVLIDAPVSGSKIPAEKGELVILAGGPEDIVNRLDPVFQCMGKKVVYCGEVGKGSAMKMTVNLLLGIMMGGLAESLNLGRHCGLDTDLLLDTILSGPLGCGLFSIKEEMLKTDSYPGQFPFKHMLKDLGFIVDTAEETGARTDLAKTLKSLYEEGIPQGLADEDFAAIKKVM
ncbi:MAG: NAD(P)-dependent oxidoreductase [Desulfurivibrionaceae bacterium]